jgi:hypothetical protein
MRTLLAKLAFICAAWHFWPATATKHGIIGMGINMYRPFCCNACTDSLSPLFLNCTTIRDGVGTTSPACRASSVPWLQTLAYCFKQGCGDDGLSNVEIQTCWNTMAGQGDEVSPYEHWIPAVAPSVEVSANAIWLNATSLVNQELYRVTRLSYEEWEYEEDMHSRLASV